MVGGKADDSGGNATMGHQRYCLRSDSCFDPGIHLEKTFEFPNTM